MYALEFIEKDLGRARQPLSRLLIPSVTLALVAMLLGLLARADFVDAFTLRNF